MRLDTMSGGIGFRRLAMFLGAAAAVAAVGVFVLVSRTAGDPLDRVARGPRRFEARLSTFSYTSVPPSRSEKTTDTADLAALAELLADLEEARTPRNLQRVAVAQLALGDARAAERLLEEAGGARSGDAGIVSDLAAAKLALGQIADAAELSARALELDPRREAAAFNWALSLERAWNRPAAISAWKTYLTLDSGSGWAVEAREHLARLDVPRATWDEDYKLVAVGTDAATLRRVMEKYPQHVRARAYNVLLPQWAESGNSAELDLIRTIAAARAAAGDPFVADVVQHAATRRLAVQPGLRAITAARAGTTLAESTRLWSQAAALFDQAGSPLRIAAEIAAANYCFYDAKADRAIEHLARVDRWLAEGGYRYPSMRTEAEWIRALILMRRSEPQAALDAYHRALEESKRIGEVEHEVFLRQLIATQLEISGDGIAAEEYRREALRRSDETNADDSRMYVAYLETAFTAVRAGRPRLALAFVDSQSGIAQRTKEPMYLAESEAQRALCLLELNQLATAVVHIDTARTHALAMPDGGFRARTLSDIEYTAARIEQARDNHAAAVQRYSAAIDIWRANGWRIHAAAGYLGRGEAALSSGDRVAAERDFRASIAEMEAQRATLDEPAMRVAWFERSADVFQRLTALLLIDKRVEEALSVVERKRSRALLDRVTGTRAATPLDAGSIARNLEPGTAMIAVVLLADGAATWLVREGETLYGRSTASRDEIEAAVARHGMAVETGNVGAVRREGRWLYEQLIGPVAAGLRGDDVSVIIVPDAMLQTFPFASLVTRTGRYFIEDHPLAVSPSASIFLRERGPSADGPLLAVAQPMPRGLAPLRAAAAEVADIARSARSGQVFVGTEIDAAGFLAAASTAALVHFGGHATADERRPQQSVLLFETREGQPERLTAEMIARSSLTARPLVVLAACATGRGTLRRNEGIDSLAWAFLHAGARGVVVTLWDVDDARSSRLFRTFHGHLRGGARPADALRETQRMLIHSAEPRDRNPAVWGSAVVIGTL